MRDFIYFIAVLLLCGCGIAYWQSSNVESQKSNPQNTMAGSPIRQDLSDDELRNAIKQRWQDRLDSVVIGNFEWKLKSPSMAAYVSFTIKNYLTSSIKDVEITCDFFGKSGTRIVSRKYTVYDYVKSKITLPIKNVFLGVVPDQVTSAACHTTHFEHARGAEQATP